MEEVHFWICCVEVILVMITPEVVQRNYTTLYI